MVRGRVLNGMRPTNKLHLGNYFGSVVNMIALQDEYECFYAHCRLACLDHRL